MPGVPLKETVWPAETLEPNSTVPLLPTDTRPVPVTAPSRISEPPPSAFRAPLLMTLPWISSVPDWSSMMPLLVTSSAISVVPLPVLR